MCLILQRPSTSRGALTGVPGLVGMPCFVAQSNGRIPAAKLTAIGMDERGRWRTWYLTYRHLA